VSHRREFVVAASGATAAVRDRLAGAAAHDLAWRIHLPPDAAIELTDRVARVSTGSDRAWIWLHEAPDSLQLAIDDGWVSARYGVKQPAPVLRLSGRCRLPATIIAIFARQPPGAVDVSPLLDELEAPA
jgi:hypothetical protein